MITQGKRIHDRDQAIQTSRWILAHPYQVLDTETTDLACPEMCQLAVLSSDGHQFKSLVQPTSSIHPEATKIHHITDQDVENAPRADQLLDKIPDSGALVIYNADFDLHVIKVSLAARGVSWDVTKTHLSAVFDAMKIFAMFRGWWDEYHGNYRWAKLGDACGYCSISLDLDLHDAMADAIMTDRLIKYMAAQKLSTEV